MFRTVAQLAVALVIAAFAAGTASAEPLSAEEALKDRILGDANAPVEIIEYASLTCPHCGDFHRDKLDTLKKDFIDTGKAKLVFRDFPFDRVGLGGAMIARCVAPDRYYQVLDVIYKKQEEWVTSKDPMGELRKIGRFAGLSDADIDTCLADKKLMDGILQHRVDAMQKYKVEATPSFIINGELITGNQPIETFTEVIEKHLKD